MKTENRAGKALVWLIVGAVSLAIIAGGATFAVLAIREHDANHDLKAAADFIKQGQLSQAEAVLQGMTERSRGTEPWFKQALALSIDLNEKQGKLDAAKEAAGKLLDPKTKAQGEPLTRAHIFLARQALRDGKADEAQAHFEAIQKIAGPNGYGADVAEAGIYRIRVSKEGPSQKLRGELEAILEKYPNSEFKNDIEDALGACNMALLFDADITGDDQLYVIQKGDTLDKLSKKYKVSPDTLMRVNNVNPKNLSIGHRIKIPNVEFSILVDKGTNTLTLFNHGKFFKRYLVRTGKVDYKTPVGEYTIKNKVKNPQWTDSVSGKRYGPNDPENELGTRWMEFQGSLGIHGTIHPESIGHYASNGCVGMRMDDVEELYDLVPLGTKVKIVGRIQKDALEADESAKKTG